MRFEAQDFRLPSKHGSPSPMYLITPRAFHSLFFALPENNRPVAHSKVRACLTTAKVFYLQEAVEQKLIDERTRVRLLTEVIQT